MYAGYLGKRFADDDHNQCAATALRERTGMESSFLRELQRQEATIRAFLGDVANEDCDRHAAAMAITKLDELVMWAKRAIDR